MIVDYIGLLKKKNSDIDYSSKFSLKSEKFKSLVFSYEANMCSVGLI